MIKNELLLLEEDCAIYKRSLKGTAIYKLIWHDTEIGLVFQDLESLLKFIRDARNKEGDKND